MICKRLLVPVLAFAAFGLPVGASVVSYCDNASPSCTEAASAFSSAGLLATDFTSASIVSGSFTDPVSGTVFYEDGGGTLTNPGDTLEDSKNGFQINLPADTLTFAFDYQTNSGSGYTVYFYTDDGATYNHFTLTAGSSPSFLGITSDSAITGLIVAGNGQFAGTISNFELQGTSGGGGDSSTPEVGTLFLIGTGLISMRWMRRLPRRFVHTPQTA